MIPKFMVNLGCANVLPIIVAQTSKSAVSRASKPACLSEAGASADLEIGGTAGLETCATGAARKPAQPAENRLKLNQIKPKN